MTLWQCHQRRNKTLADFCAGQSRERMIAYSAVQTKRYNCLLFKQVVTVFWLCRVLLRAAYWGRWKILRPRVGDCFPGRKPRAAVPRDYPGNHPRKWGSFMCLLIAVYADGAFSRSTFHGVVRPYPSVRHVNTIKSKNGELVGHIASWCHTLQHWPDSMTFRETSTYFSGTNLTVNALWVP